MKPVEAWFRLEGSSRLVCHDQAQRQAVSVNPALLRLARSRHVVLLQGPLGPFFDRLARWLMDGGCRVDRVVFQGGDRHDCRAVEPIVYRDPVESWPGFFASLLAQKPIDCLVLFGQSRCYHAAAIQVARQRGVAVVVLEEGYFRPGYVTMELDGVNGYSRTLQRYLWSPLRVVSGALTQDGPRVRVSAPDSTRGQFPRMAWHAIVHYGAMAWSKQAFPHYRHHRATSVAHYARYWLGSWMKKAWHWLPDRIRAARLERHAYYFVPLQHDGDAQIIHHSPYGANTEFILQILGSFARHAPANTRLVFRQHPHSRGGAGHARLVHSLALELGVSDRVLHVVEGHTPTLVQGARGVVVINSTVGLQALVHHRPLKVMGQALYRVDGVTFPGDLNDFWTRTPAPDPQAREHVLGQIRHLTQAPCNVYAWAGEPLRWQVARRPDDSDPIPSNVNL